MSQYIMYMLKMYINLFIVSIIFIYLIGVFHACIVTVITMETSCTPPYKRVGGARLVVLVLKGACSQRESLLSV